MTAIEEPPSTQKWVGQALRRKEDPRMITGRGRYVDDMVVPGMLYMAVVRSPEAHARITSIDNRLDIHTLDPDTMTIGVGTSIMIRFVASKPSMRGI